MTRRFADIRKWADSVKEWADKIEARLERVEKNSHPPVAFEECIVCHCVLFSGTSAADHACHHAADPVATTDVREEGDDDAE